MHAHAVSDQYWPIAAVVMPVLALAIVVEARATIQHWPKSTPRRVRTGQGILWTIPLLLFAYFEPIAFSILAGQAETTPAQVFMSSFAITVSLSILVLSPAFGLFLRSNSWLVITLARMTLGRGFRQQLRKNRRNQKIIRTAIVRMRR